MRSPSAGLAVLVAIVWGLCFVVIQGSLPSPVPLLLAALRALVGGSILAVWLAFVRLRRGSTAATAHTAMQRSWRSGLPSMRVLAALALLNAALAFGAMYEAAGRAGPAVASILAGGQPIMLAAAGWALFGERASPRTVTGLAVAVAGVGLVAAAGSGAASSDGVVLALFATAAPAAGTVLMRRLGATVDLLATTSAQFLLGGAILLVASALLEPWRAFGWTPAILLSLAVLGVLGTGLAYILWFWLLDRLSLQWLGTTLLLVPVAGVLAAIGIGDRPTAFEIVGIAVTLAGIGIVSFGGVESASKPAPVHESV